MPNVKNIIDAHNKKIIITNEATRDKPCNCRDRNNCPLNGKCRAKSIVYQATVTRSNDNTKETYVGLCETEFKDRLGNHNTSFKYEANKTKTELSKHIWNLKNQNIEYNVKWRILGHARAYSNKTKRCNLCLLEKYYIIYKPEICSLNKRNELASTCRHSMSYLLAYC